jgi:hypothetical protein
MATGHSFHPDFRVGSSGLIGLYWSVLLNGTGTVSLTPVPFGTAMSAAGTTAGLLGQDCMSYGGTFVYSTTGTWTVTLGSGMNFRSVVFADAVLDDPSGVGQYATIGGMTNQGGTKPLSFSLFTFSNTSGAALTNSTNRVYFTLICKNGSVGS